MVSLTTNARAAIAYAERFGWEVFPVRPGTKRPEYIPGLLEHGHLSATREVRLVERLWRLRPEASIGVNCAASGLVVLDVDAYKPECTFGELEARLGRLPVTPTVLSPSGGSHYYFRDSVGHYSGKACEGCEVKHHGLTVLPGSVHANGRPYVWDVGAHVVDTAIADLPDAWLHYLTTGRTTAKGPGQALPSSGVDARESWLGVAFEAAGWLGDGLGDGRRMARCPWVHEHSDGRGDGRDSSCVLFPKAEGHSLGGFRCLHAHCEGRDARQVVDALPRVARWTADRAINQERNRLAFARLEAMRKAAGQ